MSTCGRIMILLGNADDLDDKAYFGLVKWYNAHC